MAVAGELFVDIQALDDLGAFLISLDSTLSDKLSTLKTEFGKITDSWKDSDGEALKGKYDEFIKSADELCTKLQSLGEIATTESKGYESAKSKAIGNLL